MTRKIHKRSKVSRTESTNEPRQPSRLEKKRNTHAGCPAGHGPTRGVSGVSGSTTLFHMLAQTRRELLAAVHDRRNRDQRGSRRCAVHAAPAMELVVRGREQSPGEPHRFTGLDPERHDVLDLEVDPVATRTECRLRRAGGSRGGRGARQRRRAQSGCSSIVVKTAVRTCLRRAAMSMSKTGACARGTTSVTNTCRTSSPRRRSSRRVSTESR